MLRMAFPLAPCPLAPQLGMLGLSLLGPFPASWLGEGRTVINSGWKPCRECAEHWFCSLSAGHTLMLNHNFGAAKNRPGTPPPPEPLSRGPREWCSLGAPRRLAPPRVLGFPFRSRSPLIPLF